MSSRAPSISVRPAAKTRLAVALIAAASLLGACGDGDDSATAESKTDAKPSGVIDISGTDAVGENVGGSVAPLVECRDWVEANPDEKLATIDDVRSQVSRDDAGIRSAALTDEEALTIFDNVCEPEYAQGFRLYKLYARAAGFAPFARALQQP